MSLTDQSTRIRAGEELDAAVIDPYLKAHIPGLEGTPKISQFPGGASNLTYLIESIRARSSSCVARHSATRPSRPTTWAANTAS